jgi:putative aminopeptidase
MSKSLCFIAGVSFVVLLLGCNAAWAQQGPVPGTLVGDLREFIETPAVPGYEQELAGKISSKLRAFSPNVDSLSNVVVTVGQGSPHRLIVAPLDEPGFVISGITPEGYLTLQRLPQGGNLPLFNELYSAQPVKIGTARNRWIDGAVAGLSVHLQPQRQHPPAAADLDNLFVDIGATNPAEARTGGADVLTPLAIDRRLYQMGFGKWTAPAIGDRFGAAALLEVLRDLDPATVKGTITFAFVTQQWVGARGLQRILYQVSPDEVIYVGRTLRRAAVPAERETAPVPKEAPGSGVLIASEKPESDLGGFAAEWKGIAAQNKIAIKNDYSAPVLPGGGYMLQPALPERTVHLAIATAWPSTPAEVVQGKDLTSLVSLREIYLSGQAQKHDWNEGTALPEPAAPERPHTAPPVETILKQLIETYAVSGHEANMREAVTKLLPAWAKPETDSAVI